ncbi:MAG: S-adenosylmethionine decarboxylase [Trueperaceae bacterium]
METLGYGTQLIIDGFSAESNLSNTTTIEACLRAVAGLLESTPGNVLTLETPTGNSAALRLAESHIALHTFNDTKSLCLRIFSRHDLRPGDMTDLLEQHFGVRRVESYLSNHAKTMPTDTDAQQRTLLGDRTYCALRFVSVF